MTVFKQFGFAEQLAPAAEVLLRFIEDDTKPDRVVEEIATALLIMAEVAEVDEMGLWSATPEQRVAARPECYPCEVGACAQFDPARYTSYVEHIYAAEVEAVFSEPATGWKGQLHRSAYGLARLAASGCLPIDHVRDSLTAAASSWPTTDVATIIDSALRKGVANPRLLPCEEA